eukprot:523277_1
MYKINDKHLDSMLRQDVINQQQRDSIQNIRVYLICQQDISIPIKATYIDERKQYESNDHFRISLTFNNNFRLDHLINNITTRINDRHISNHYTSEDIYFKMTTRTTYNVNDAISYSDIDYLRQYGLSVTCVAHKENVE